MPIYRTGPGIALDDLVNHIESRGEEIVSVTHLGEGEWTIITKPMLRIMSNLGATETRRS